MPATFTGPVARHVRGTARAGDLVYAVPRDPARDLIPSGAFGSHARRWVRDGDSMTGETHEHRQRYRVHLADPNIKARILDKVLGVAQLDPQFVPEDPDDDRQKQVADYHRYNVEQSDGGLLGIVEALTFGPLLEGYGVAHARQRPDPARRGKWAGKLVLERLKPKDPQHFDLVTDRFRDITGVRPRHRDEKLGDPEFIPRSELVVTQHLSIYDLPEGMSDLRAADRAACCLDAVMELRAIAAANYSGPYLVAREVPETLKNAMAARLTDARGRGHLELPPGVALDVVNLAAGAEGDYQSFCAFCREEIATAISGAYLQGMTGTGERGNALVANGIADSRIWYLCQLVANAYRRDVVPYFTDINFAGDVPYPFVVISGQNPAWNKAQLELGTMIRAAGVDTSERDWYRNGGGWGPPRNEADRVPGLPAAPPPGPGGGGDPLAGLLGGPGGDFAEGEQGRPFDFAAVDLGPLGERAELIADILFAIFGEDALTLFDAPADTAAKQAKDGRASASQLHFDGDGQLLGLWLFWLFWDSTKHPRGPDGRFIPAGGPAALNTARGKVSEALKGPKTADSHRELTEHLSILTTDQLKEIKAQYDIKASGRTKGELTAKIADRLDRGRREPDAGPAAPKGKGKGKGKGPAKGKPAVPDAPAAPAPAPAAPRVDRGRVPAATKDHPAYRDPAPGTERVASLDVPKEIDDSAKGWAAKLPSRQKDAVEEYSGDWYDKGNRALRSDPTGASLSGADRKTFEDLRAAVRSAPEFEAPVTTYRGMKIKDGEKAALFAAARAAQQSGDGLQFAGFQSTSLNAEEAVAWSGTMSRGPVLEIKAKQGAYIQPLSSSPGERELLLDHNTVYRVLGIEENVPFRDRSGIVARRDVLRLEQVVDAQDSITPDRVRKTLTGGGRVVRHAERAAEAKFVGETVEGIAVVDLSGLGGDDFAAEAEQRRPFPPSRPPRLGRPRPATSPLPGPTAGRPPSC